MEKSFNAKYQALKDGIVQLINNSGIPAAVIRDYLAGDVIVQLDRVVAREMAQEEEDQEAEET